ncbi:Curlin associated repeat-containing protein [Solimonas aquatica]|uniref:Curlin associated repeat-containing protein n=2 Tax=Solimonas aquatica TaxID=489703 RepID=A0A1H9DLA9_9GAMM|nr:Curlin associated repeat-containing protein [Solimonas aquatica]
MPVKMLTALFLLLPALALAQSSSIDQIVDAQKAFEARNTEGGASIAPAIENYLLALQSTATLALIEQSEGVGNRADIRQLAPQNQAAVFQGHGDGNLADIEQNGVGNLAIVTQTGSGNLLSALEQAGNGNSATVLQAGSFNSADIHQYGDNNSLNLQQNDQYNSATISEYGQVALSITQSNPGGSAASVNALKVSAVVESGYSSGFGPITTTGTGNTALNLCSGSDAFCASH